MCLASLECVARKWEECVKKRDVFLMCCSLKLANKGATTGAMQHAEHAFGDKVATQPVHVSISPSA